MRRSRTLAGGILRAEVPDVAINTLIRFAHCPVGWAILASDRPSPGALSSTRTLTAEGVSERRATLWNIDTGKQLNSKEFRRGRSIVLNPVKPLVASYGNGELLVWDMLNDRKVIRLSAPVGYPVLFSPDGRFLAWRTWKEQQRRLAGPSRLRQKNYSKSCVGILDLETKRRLSTDKLFAGGLFPAAFSDNSQRLAISSLQEEVRVFDVSTGAVVNTFNDADWDQPNRHLIYFLRLSTNGKFLASCCTNCFREHRIALRNLENNRSVTVTEPPFYPRIIDFSNRSWARQPFMTFAPSGTSFLTADNFGDVHLRDCRTGEITRTWKVHENAVRTLVFSPNGLLLVTTGHNCKRLSIWQFNTAELIARLDIDESNIPAYVIFGPDSNSIAAISHQTQKGYVKNSCVDIRKW